MLNIVLISWPFQELFLDVVLLSLNFSYAEAPLLKVVV